MCIAPEARDLAAAHFDAAVAMIANRSEGKLQELAMEALDRRDSDATDALLKATARGPWEHGLLHALAQVAIILSPVWLPETGLEYQARRERRRGDQS